MTFVSMHSSFWPVAIMGLVANTTTDPTRSGWCILPSSYGGYLRQEENQYLANDVERIKELPLWLQRFVAQSAIYRERGKS